MKIRKYYNKYIFLEKTLELARGVGGLCIVGEGHLQSESGHRCDKVWRAFCCQPRLGSLKG